MLANRNSPSTSSPLCHVRTTWRQRRSFQDFCTQLATIWSLSWTEAKLKRPIWLLRFRSVNMKHSQTHTSVLSDVNQFFSSVHRKQTVKRVLLSVFEGNRQCRNTSQTLAAFGQWCYVLPLSLLWLENSYSLLLEWRLWNVSSSVLCEGQQFKPAWQKVYQNFNGNFSSLLLLHCQQFVHNLLKY